VGYVLVRAKRHYLQPAAELSAYDEKVVMELTLYGLPMHGVEPVGSPLGERR
jgi:hypothetical protein